VFELSSKGYSQSDIARVLQIDKSVICRDLAFLRQQSKTNIHKYIDERLSEEYEKCLVGLCCVDISSVQMILPALFYYIPGSFNRPDESNDLVMVWNCC
jgi:hypothetical protein